MENTILSILYYIILVPFGIFLLSISEKISTRFLNKYLIYFLTLISSFSGILYSLYGLINIGDKIIEKSFNLFLINNYNVTYGICIDKVSLIFSLTLFIVSFAVQLFSISYLKEDNNHRFFAFLNIFNFSMLGLIFSQSLYQLYVFWELVGIVSYLMINYDYMNEITSKLSKRILIINRIGDMAFLTAILIISYLLLSGGWYNFANLSIGDIASFSNIIHLNVSSNIYVLCSLLFIIAALVKSAQIPFYNWLQDAMNAKLPVSALLHSATMVAMGIFLIIRVLPIFVQYDILLKIISMCGLLTVVVCSLCACAQDNPKKLLAYSTSSQLGLMFLALGSLDIIGAVVFFVSHALSKSLMFLTLNINQQKLNSLLKFAALIFGGLSTMGILFSGRISKEMIFSNLKPTYEIFYVLISIITVFYVVKLIVSQYKQSNFEKAYSPSVEDVSFLILILANIGLYICLKNNYSSEISYIFYLSIIIIPLAVFITLKTKPAGFAYRMLSNGMYLDKIYNGFGKLYSALTKVCKNIDDKVFSNYEPIKLLSKYSVCFVNIVETKLMNGYVNLIEFLSKLISQKDSNIQNSDIRNYNAYALIITTICLILLIMVYTGILILIGEK